MKAMKMYVLYSVTATKFMKAAFGARNKRYIITCDTEEEAKKAASDIYSYDGVSHIKIVRNRPKTQNLIDATIEKPF